MNTTTLPRHIIIEARPAWLRGLVAVLGYILFCSILEHQDARIEQKAHDHQVLQLHTAQLAAQIHEAESAPQVRLAGDAQEGFECKQMHIRPEWSLAVGKKCAELAETLRIARTIP